MTEKKTYCFTWRCHCIEKAPPYKDATFGGGAIQSIIRLKAYKAAWRGALEDIKLVYPDSLLTGDDIPILYRSCKFYRLDYETTGHIYRVFMEEVTK